MIPFERLHDCSGVLSSHFANLNIFRMTDPASTQYRQIVALGVRRDVRGGALESNRSQLQRMGLYGSIQSLPELGSQACAPYSVPPSDPAVLTYRGLPYDLLEDLLPQFHRLEAGGAALVATRGCRDWPTDYAAARRSCGAIVHGRSSERRIRRRRRSPYRSMALGQARHDFCGRRRGYANHPPSGTVGKRTPPGLRGRKDHETD